MDTVKGFSRELSDLALDPLPRTSVSMSLNEGSVLSLKCILRALQGDTDGVKVLQWRRSTENAEPTLRFFENILNLSAPGSNAGPHYLELLLTCGNYKTHTATRRPEETDCY